MGNTSTYSCSQCPPSHEFHGTGSDAGNFPWWRGQPTAGRGCLSDIGLQTQFCRLDSVYHWHMSAGDDNQTTIAFRTNCISREHSGHVTAMRLFLRYKHRTQHKNYIFKFMTEKPGVACLKPSVRHHGNTTKLSDLTGTHQTWRAFRQKTCLFNIWTHCVCFLNVG